MATILAFYAIREGQVVLLELECGLLSWWAFARYGFACLLSSCLCQCPVLIGNPGI